MENVAAYEAELGAYLHRQLSSLPVRIYGPDPAAGHARAARCAFNAEGAHAADVATFLDQDGFAIRAGHHCTQPLHDVLGAAGSARASLYIYNTHEEVDAFVDALGSTLLLLS